MKTRLSQCLENLQEVEAKMLELDLTTDLRAHHRVAICESLAFVRYAITALKHSQFELVDVPEQTLRMNDWKRS